jgi:hypothetical protein
MGTKYRCYLLDADHHISEATVIECENDAAALLEADRLLALSADKSVEVWDRSRKVSILSRNTTAA